jgi:hypothetical protein
MQNQVKKLQISRDSRALYKSIAFTAAFMGAFLITPAAHASSTEIVSSEYNFNEVCGNDRDCRIELSRRSTMRALQKASDAHQRYIDVIDREGERICKSSTIAMDFLQELTGLSRVGRAQRYAIRKAKGARNKAKYLHKKFSRAGDKKTARKFKEMERDYDRVLRQHKREEKLIKLEFDGIGTRTQKMRCGRFAPKKR